MLRVGDRVRITMPSSFRYGEEYEVLEVNGRSARLGRDFWYTSKFLEQVCDPTRSSTNRRLKAWKERGGVL